MALPLDTRDLVRRIRTLEQELQMERERRGALAYNQQALRAKLLRLEAEVILMKAETGLALNLHTLNASAYGALQTTFPSASRNWIDAFPSSSSCATKRFLP